MLLYNILLYNFKIKKQIVINALYLLLLFFIEGTNYNESYLKINTNIYNRDNNMSIHHQSKNKVERNYTVHAIFVEKDKKRLKIKRTKKKTKKTPTAFEIKEKKRSRILASLLKKKRESWRACPFIKQQQKSNLVENILIKHLNRTS